MPKASTAMRWAAAALLAALCAAPAAVLAAAAPPAERLSDAGPYYFSWIGGSGGSIGHAPRVDPKPDTFAAIGRRIEAIYKEYLQIRGQRKTDLLAGQWEGTWLSTSNGMGDRLRCTVTKTAEGKYVANFEAIFAKVFTHKSTITLNVTAGGAKWLFRGEEDLGLLSGGVYAYEGHSDGQEFYSTYDSSIDQGIFRMKRVD
jgi:hypothetical protein